MEPVAAVMEVDDDGEENILDPIEIPEIRLGAISVKEALKSTSQEFQSQDPMVNKSMARILWQIVSREIPRIHGEDGERVVHLMEMMAYIGDDKYEYRKKRIMPHIQESLLTASNWGLLKLSENFNFDGDFYSESELGTMHFHSMVLMDVIMEGSKDRELDLLKSCVSSGLIFQTKNYYSIWSLAMKYEDKELFRQFESTDLIEDGTTKPEYQELFEKIIRQHETLFGKRNARTMLLKSFDAKRMIRDQETSLEDKWEKWGQENGYKFSLNEMFETRENEEYDDEDKDLWVYVMDWEYLTVQVVEEMFSLVSSPRPRPEYEEKFLNEAFQMAMNLHKFGIVRWHSGQAVDLLITMIPHAEELGKVGIVLELLDEWWDFIVEHNLDVDLVEYEEDSTEMEAIAKCLQWAAATSISTSSYCRAILEKLKPVIDLLYEDIRRTHSRQQRRQPEVAASICRLVLFRVQCLEGLKKFNKVVQTAEGTAKFRKRVEWKQWPLEGTITDYNNEIDVILSRCYPPEQF